MMKDPHSADLDRIRTLLAKSLDASEGDDAPPLPEGLRDRINDQYGRQVAAATPAHSGGWLAKLSTLFAQPAFVGVAAAVVLLLVAVVMLKQPDRPSTFRGGSNGDVTATIVLFQVDATTTSAILASGYFDEEAVVVIRSQEDLDALAPPAIIIDGTSNSIRTLNGEASEATTTELPANANELPDLIAELLRSM